MELNHAKKFCIGAKLAKKIYLKEQLIWPHLPEPDLPGGYYRIFGIRPADVNAASSFLPFDDDENISEITGGLKILLKMRINSRLYRTNTLIRTPSSERDPREGIVLGTDFNLYEEYTNTVYPCFTTRCTEINYSGNLVRVDLPGKFDICFSTRNVNNVLYSSVTTENGETLTISMPVGNRFGYVSARNMTINGIPTVAGVVADMTIYGCQIIRESDGEILRDLVPAKDMNGYCGLYDLQNETFHLPWAGNTVYAAGYTEVLPEEEL